jgi:hypothetical protein
LKRYFLGLLFLSLGCSSAPPLPKAFQEPPSERQDNDDFTGYVITDPNKHASFSARVRDQLGKMNDDLRAEFKLKSFHTLFRGFTPGDKATAKPCKVTIYDFEKHKLKPKDKILIEISLESDAKTKEDLPKFTFGSTEDVKMLDDPDDNSEGWRVYETRNYLPYSDGDNLKWFSVKSSSENRAVRAEEGEAIPGKLTPRKSAITCEHLR